MTAVTEAQARRREIAENLARVEARIQAACDAAGRPREEVTLVAVTKTFPASDVGHLAALGVLGGRGGPASIGADPTPAQG